MNKNTIAAIIAVFLIGGALVYVGQSEGNGSANLTAEENNKTTETETENDMESFIDCLAEEEVVIYGSKWCPACSQLVENFGGYDIVDPIYVECTEEGEICGEEQKTTYVPEIQIKGEVYEGPRSFEGFTEKTGCSFKN